MGTLATLTLSFSGTTGTLSWSTASPPVVQNITSLPKSITLSGGGEAPGVNGIYTPAPAPNAIFGGTTQYVNPGGYYINFGFNGGWSVSNAPGQGYLIYLLGAGTVTQFPASGRATTPTGDFNGALPYPLFNTGLIISGLSGGTLIIGNVTTTGTTTTFTTSRAIGSAETGGSLSCVAGAFQDSTATPNANAAFTIPIVPSQFQTASVPQNFALAFFSPSAGGPPSLSASWQQPAEGQPDGGYNLYLGNAPGMETQALNVPGSAASHTFPAYGYGTVYGVVKALYGGAESTPSNEATATGVPPTPVLTATPQIINGVTRIVLAVT